MKVRWRVLLFVAMMLAVQSCGDGESDLLSRGSSLLVKFKRVTLATDAPDRLEIEIVVRAGHDFTAPAPDGTKVVVETSTSQFEGNGPIVVASTVGGHAVVRLVVPSGATHAVVTAKVDDVEARLSIVVDEYGSLRLLS